jgi:hypothetical protein
VSVLAATFVAIAVAAPCRAADEVAAYLERLGLLELLAVHLEQRLEASPSAGREGIVLRLAGIYAQLLEQVEDTDRRLDLDRRSRKLLADAPAGAGNELRLALLRATYRSAEKLAESHRLRVATDEEIARARGMFDELVPELVRLRKLTEDAVERAERRLSRASGTQALVLREESEQARSLHAQCQFLSAWALYYDAWLAGEREGGRAAERLFIELLDFGNEPPMPENVSVDLRATEAIARCVLGMALCKSLTASTGTALAWAELLEHERTFEELRDQAPVWRIAILLEHGEYIQVQSMLDRRKAAGLETPIAWLRLVAAGALEAERSSRHAGELARAAITELAARGELAQVFDLAERYGISALGTSGFAMRYVSGVLKYYEAREIHDGDEPTVDAAAVLLFGEALDHLERALEEPDASFYAASLPDGQRLIAWCHYFRHELIQARAAFERAAEMLAPDEAADALWMAILCLDRLLEADGRSPALEDELVRLTKRFLAEYPSSEHAPKLVLRRALTTGEVSPAVVDELLAIPATSDVHGTARRRAAQVLYRLFRDAKGLERIGYGTRYLAVAVDLQERERSDLDRASALAVERFVVRARRILEVALHEGIARLDAAQAALRAIEELFPDEEEREERLGELEAELTYRRLQERLLGDDIVTAASIADELWEAEPDGIWARLAARTIFRDASRRWRTAGADRSDERGPVRLLLKYGERVLGEYADDPDAFQDRGALTYAVAVAEAAMTIWERSGDPDRGREALALYERLLAVRPRNAAFLRATALLSETLGSPERALECWRTLMAGTSQGAAGWYEAKYRLINLLATLDAPRAREVMAQHRALNPDYGPDPWGAQLRALDLRLRVEAPEDDPETDDVAERGAEGAGAGSG